MFISIAITWLVLIAIVLVTLGPALFIGRLTAAAIPGWYATLRKPSWNPPSWLFGPVWTVLYLAMSVAFWLVWQAAPECYWALGLYAIQLVLNHAWSPIFFLWHKPGIAFCEMLVLIATVIATTIQFYLVVPLAGQLLLPYLAWLFFAACLNYRIWQDNQTS